MPEPAWHVARITAIDDALLARLNHDWPDEPWARELGADCTWVLTERSNHAAMALYRAAGDSDDIPEVAMFPFSSG